jgi:hypothetical protein
VFRVGEPVWHRQYKRGVVAYSIPNDVRVDFDDKNNNPLISTEPPPYFSKKNLEGMSGEEKLQMTEAIEQMEAKGAALEGHIIEFPGGLGPNKHTLGKYNYPLQDGYFQVLKVQQAFAGMKWEEVRPGHFTRTPQGTPSPTGERRFFPAKNIVDVQIQDVVTGKKYKVQIDRTQYPSIYVARKVPEDSLAILFDEGDLWWGEKQSEEQPNEGQL